MRIIVAAALLAFSPCIAHSQAEFRFDRDIGIAGIDKNGLVCARFPHPRPEAGSSVVLASTLPRAVLHDAEVLPASASRCPESDPALGDSLVALRVRGATALSSPSYWFALRVPPNAVAIVGTGITGELSPDGVLESLRVCTSQEGLWFSVWTGEPLIGRRRWAEYVALFYDVDPSCDERDFADPTR